MKGRKGTLVALLGLSLLAGVTGCSASFAIGDSEKTGGQSTAVKNSKPSNGTAGGAAHANTGGTDF